MSRRYYDGEQSSRPNQGYRERRSHGLVRLLAVLGVVGFAVTMAAIIGQRLNDQTISVLAGALCGVSASIPTSLLVAWATNRRKERERQTHFSSGAYPPVVVVQPPQPPPPTPSRHNYLSPYQDPSPRKFRVVGGDQEADEF